MEKVPHNASHALNLGFGELGENRQAQAFARCFFGNGEIAGLVSEKGIRLLQMERQRVVQGAADVIGFEVLFEFIPAGMTHHVEVPRAFGIIRFPGQLQRGSSE